MANPELKIVISGNADKFRKELNRIESDVSNTTDKITKVNYNKMAVAFAALTTSVGTALKQFAQYETALVAAARTTGLEGAELDDFAKKIDEISGRLNTPREQLLKIAEVAGTLGIKGADNLAKFTETMAKFDVASATLKGDAAANSIARIINLTGGGVENVENFASEIAYLADNFKSTEAETVAIAEELSRLNAKIPLSTENTIALAAAFADLGITPEIARTGLSQFATSLDESLRDGGDKLKMFTTLTGMTREELKETFQKAPEKVFTAFSQGLGAAGEDATFILSKLGLDQDRLAGLFLASAQNSDVLTRAITEGNKAAAENTKLNEETAKVLETTASKWDGLKVSVGNVVAELGEKLAPTANATFDALSFGFDTLYKDLNEDIPNAFNALINIIKALTLSAGAELARLLAKSKLLFADFLSGMQNIAAKAGIKLDFSSQISGLENNALSLGMDANAAYAKAKALFEPQEKAAQEHNQNMADIRAEGNQTEIDQNAEHQETKAEIQSIIDEAEAERLAEQREADLELKQEQFDEDMALLQEHLDAAVSLQNNALVKDLANQKKALQEKAKIDGLKVKGTMEVTKAEMQLRQIAVADAIAGFQAMFKSGTALSKAFFLIGKAAAIAEGIVNTNVAYTKALAETANPGYAQLIWAAGMLKVALIGATAIKEVGGAQQGGIVPGFGSGDRVPMMLEPGELVVPKQIRPNFEEYMKGMGGGGTQGVQVMIGLDENASRVLTVKQREDSKLGIQS